MYEVTVYLSAWNGESADEIQTAVRDAIDHATDLYAESVLVSELTATEEGEGL